MWKKPDENKTSLPEPAIAIPVPQPQQPNWASGEEIRTERALLGPSLTVEGTINGSEDLVIQGKIKGTVDLKKHSVTVGKQGKIEGDIFARMITVEGEVHGNLSAAEKVIIHKSGFVKGNVACPRVIVEDGARLKGSIDVDAGVETKKDPAGASTAVDKDKFEKRPNGALAQVM